MAAQPPAPSPYHALAEQFQDPVEDSVEQALKLDTHIARDRLFKLLSEVEEVKDALNDNSYLNIMNLLKHVHADLLHFSSSAISGQQRLHIIFSSFHRARKLREEQAERAEREERAAVDIRERPFLDPVRDRGLRELIEPTRPADALPLRRSVRIRDALR